MWCGTISCTWRFLGRFDDLSVTRPDYDLFRPCHKEINHQSIYSIKPRKRNTRCNSSSSPGSLKIGNHCNPEDDVRITKNKSVLLATNPRGPRQRAEIRVDTCWKPTWSQVWSQKGTCLTNMDCVSSCDMPFVCHHKSLNEGPVCFFITVRWSRN